METTLNHATKAAVRRDPFPHVVINEALPATLADELRAQFPATETLAEGKELGSNRRFSYSATKVADDERVPDAWKEVIRAHITESFFNEFVALFADAVYETYPDFRSKFGDLDAFRVGTRGAHDFSQADILLDAQLCVNTPVRGSATSVRGPHVDISDKLFAGLYYLRDSQDDSEGGDLVLYRWKKGSTPQFFNKQYAPAHLVEEIGRVPYQHNTLVLFINSPHSLHGVTPRHQTPFPRTFMNLVGEVSHPLFDLAAYKEQPMTTAMRKLSGLFNAL